MHKRTLDALDRNGFAGQAVTVWDGGRHNGSAGTIAGIVQPRTVRVRLYDGTLVDADHRKVCLGDNSD
jgi:hypothetical protein